MDISPSHPKVADLLLKVDNTNALRNGINYLLELQGVLEEKMSSRFYLVEMNPEGYRGNDAKTNNRLYSLDDGLDNKVLYFHFIPTNTLGVSPSSNFDLSNNGINELLMDYIIDSSKSSSLTINGEKIW